MWRFLEVLVGAALAVVLILVLAGLRNEDDPLAYLPGLKDESSIGALIVSEKNDPASQQIVPSQRQFESWMSKVRQVDVGTGFFLFFETDTGVGTGFYIAPDRLLTAGHIVTNAAERDFRVSNGAEVNYVSHVVDSSQELDVAILAPNRQLQSTPGLVFSLSPAEAEVGTRGWGVCAYPELEVIPMTVQATSQRVTLNDPRTGAQQILVNAIVLSGEAHQGCSGGPVINASGDVVGVMVGGRGGLTHAADSVALRAWLRSERYLD